MLCDFPTTILFQLMRRLHAYKKVWVCKNFPPRPSKALALVLSSSVFGPSQDDDDYHILFFLFRIFFCALQFISQFLSMLDKLIFNERQNIPLTCMRHIYYSFKTRHSIRQLKIQTTSKIFKQKQTCYAIARRRNQEKVFIEKKQCRMSIRDSKAA